MLPLSGESFPSTSSELASAIELGLSAQDLTARSVHAEGGDFPEIGALAIDLTKARATRALRVPSLKPDGKGEVIQIGKFELTAEPLYFEQTPFELRINASHAKFVFAGEPKTGALMITDAKEGAIHIAAATKDLETLLHEIVVDAAEKQGVEVKKTHLELTAQGPRTLTFRAEVTAKMFIMTAALTLAGKLDVDGELNARFSGLTLSGDGMITKLANGFIRPKLDQLENRAIPLLAFSLGDLRLRDVEISTGSNLTIQAVFGSDARE